MGRKAIRDVDKRRPVSVSLSPSTIRCLDHVCEAMGISRSGAIEDALGIYWRYYMVYGSDRSEWLDDDPQPPEIPDEEDM